MVRCGVVWCDVVRCGVVWCGEPSATKTPSAVPEGSPSIGILGYKLQYIEEK